MITLFHAPQTRSTRILWLLEEIGQPYEIKPVSIFRPMTGEGQADPANPHPDGRVPAIVHDGQTLAESVAIILYLTETFPDAALAPRPGEAQRGDFLTWVAWYAAEMEPALFAGFEGALDNPMKKRGYDAVLGRILWALDEGEYMLGDHFTAVDLLVASAIAFGRKVFPESAVLDAYVARCQARPAAIRGAALDSASGVQSPTAALADA